VWDRAPGNGTIEKKERTWKRDGWERQVEMGWKGRGHFSSQ